MTNRPGVLCGVVFSAAALGACWAALTLAPGRLMDRLRADLTASCFAQPCGAPVNAFLHQRSIGPPPNPLLGPPDPTALVSSAWIDLSAGPMRLAVPPTGGRPFAILVLDGEGDRIGVASPHIVGRAGASIVIAGPHWAGPPLSDAAILRAGTQTAWIVARFAVAGGPDEEDVRAIQNDLRLTRERASSPDKPLAR